LSYRSSHHRLAPGSYAGLFGLGVLLVVCTDSARRFAFQIDAPRAGKHALKVTLRAAIHRERSNELGPSNAAAERGEEVGVDANLERPAARVWHGETFRKLCGQHGYDRLGSRALCRHSPRPRVWVYLYYISRQSCDGFGDKPLAGPDLGRPHNSTLIFTKS
jgi:hypothetical protein